MSAIWIIASNDLRVFLKEKWGYVWLFLMPLLFVYFFGTAMRGGNGQPSDPRPTVSIENSDDGYLGAIFVDLLEAEGLRVLDPSGDESSDRTIVIPEDFTAKVEAAEETAVGFRKKAESGAEPAAMLEIRATRAIVALTSAIFSLVSEDEQGAVSEDGIREFLEREKSVELQASFAGRKKVPTGFEQSVPGYTVMFVLMNLLIFGGLSISGERTNGVLRRIAVHPIERWQLVTGKVLGRFLLGIVQIVYMLAVSRLLFGMDYGGNLLLVAGTLLIFAWGCASLGVFIGAVVKDPESVQGLCTLGSVAFAALGGCWWPLEVVPDFARRIGSLFPTAWAMSAMHQLISFGGGFEQIIPELLLMSAFAAVSTLLAARFLRVY